MIALKEISESHLVIADSLWPHGLYSPWNSLGQNIGVGSCSLPQGIFPTQGLNPGLPHGFFTSWATREALKEIKDDLNRVPYSKEIQPVHPKGNQSWIFIGRTDAEAETPVLWPPDAKNWLIGKDPNAGKYWRWEEKGMTEDEMVGWHHRLDGH